MASGLGRERTRSRRSSGRVRIRRRRLSPKPQSREQANPKRRLLEGSPTRPPTRGESGPCSVVVLSSETTSEKQRTTPEGVRYGFDRGPLDGLGSTNNLRNVFTCVFVQSR